MDFQKNRAHLLHRFDNYWKHKGSLIRMTVIPEDEKAQQRIDYERFHLDVDYNIQVNLEQARNKICLADTLPFFLVDYGCVALAAFLGTEETFAPDDDTVWYEPWLKDIENHPEFKFDPENKWWKIQTAVMDGLRPYADEGIALLGCTAFSAGADALAAMRGTENFLMDMIDCPEAVHECMEQLDNCYFEMYDHLYPKLLNADGTTAFTFFDLWGTGKTTQMQCDVSAMLSPAMFDEFAAPTFDKAGEYFDNILYHVDGSQALCHLDRLLSIPGITALEWTPEPTVSTGGSPDWYPLYRKIKDAGKSVQAVNVKPEELIPLIDAVGYEGLYCQLVPTTERESYDILNELSKISGMMD